MRRSDCVARIAKRAFSAACMVLLLSFVRLTCKRNARRTPDVPQVKYNPPVPWKVAICRLFRPRGVVFLLAGRRGGGRLRRRSIQVDEIPAARAAVAAAETDGG